MPRISEIYKLGKTQRELDFVNINPRRDLPLFLNPFVFSSRDDAFSIDASRVVQSFFQHNIDLINNNRESEARNNFSHLNEPNETCFGLSRKKPSGRGIDIDGAEKIFDSILKSKALSSGLVEHLENTAIFINGIGRDKVSDMTTNIIKHDLIRYTQSQCNLLGIALTPNTPSGFYWDTVGKRWNQELTNMLIINRKRILLVPKAVVSYVKEFTHGKYHQHFALEFLQDDHLSRDTSLVQTTYNKNGSIRRRFVTKKDLKLRELTSDKEELLEFTRRHPEVFNNFREATSKIIIPLDDSELETIDVNLLIEHLINSLKKIPPGNVSASAYHKLMIGILEFIFYPNLINPVRELEINEGRKRIDISFDNGAPPDGFFHRLQYGLNIPCRYIYIECKNYSNDINNPELDQMAGRLAPNKGKFGIIMCRDLKDEALFMRRCADSYKSDHGLIVPFVDGDIIRILEEKKNGILHYEDKILSDKSRIIMNS